MFKALVKAAVANGQLVLLAAIGFAIPATAQTSNSDCIVEIEFPRYINTLLVAGESTVEAIVAVGASGKPTKVSVASKKQGLFGAMVKGIVERRGRFQPNCKGREVRLIFEFRLEGDASDYPEMRAIFKAPNRFVLISQPLAPIIDVAK